MNTTKVIAIAFMALGLLGLVYGGINYSRESSEVKIGSMELTVNDRERTTIPLWAGIGFLVVGGGLMAYEGRRVN